MTKAKPSDIDSYIAGFPEETQKLLNQVRATIRKAAPGAAEIISYAMPTFTMNGTYLVYFAGWKNHISIYPAPTGDVAFKKDFAAFKTNKGTVQFPIDKPMPLGLITKIVKYRIRENLQKAKTKKK
jgi:uncharacterized protein YdhG (YjbR/CyaY superfamily)